MKAVGGKNLSKTKRASAPEDRALSKTLAGVEKIGRSPNKVMRLAAAMEGMTAVAERLSPPGTVPSFREDSNKYLRVPDVETLEDFLKQAKKVYREAHSHTPQRGRPTWEIDAFYTLLELSSKSGGVPTQGKMVSTLMEKPIKLSKNTAYRYAKLYRLSLRWSRGQIQFTDAERQWIAKNKGTDSWSTLNLIRLYLRYKRRWEEEGGDEMF